MNIDAPQVVFQQRIRTPQSFGTVKTARLAAIAPNLQQDPRHPLNSIGSAGIVEGVAPSLEIVKKLEGISKPGIFDAATGNGLRS